MLIGCREAAMNTIARQSLYVVFFKQSRRLNAEISSILQIIEESGCFPNSRSMDKLFFKPHELAARDRKKEQGAIFKISIG
jgi:hypothetical protein